MSETNYEIYHEILNMLHDQYRCFTLSRKQCARALGISVPTLDRWRSQPIPFGPKVIKNTGGDRTAVLYSIADVAAFLSKE